MNRTTPDPDPNREAHRRVYPECRRRDCDLMRHDIARINRDHLIAD